MKHKNTRKNPSLCQRPVLSSSDILEQGESRLLQDVKRLHCLSESMRPRTEAMFHLYINNQRMDEIKYQDKKDDANETQQLLRQYKKALGDDSNMVETMLTNHLENLRDVYCQRRDWIQAELKFQSSFRPVIQEETLLRQNFLTQEFQRTRQAIIDKIMDPVRARRASPDLGRLGDPATLVLRRWFYDNVLKPYPDKQAKQELVAKVGLSEKQVSNWFINARSRYWKPMIESMPAKYKESLSSDITGSTDVGSVESDQSTGDAMDTDTLVIE